MRRCNHPALYAAALGWWVTVPGAAAAQQPMPAPAATSASRGGETGQVITLAEAQRKAARFNPSFKNVSEMVQQADTMIQSAWAMLLPNVSATGSVTRHDKEIVFPSQELPPEAAALGFDEPFTVQDLWGKAFGFSANIALFNPRSIPGIQIAYDLAEQAQLQARIDRNDLLFAVTSAYYQVHSMGELVQVAEENLGIAERFLRLSEVQLEVGQKTRIDVLRARLEEMDAQKELANARDAVKKAKTALAYLTGIEGAFSVAPPDQAVPLAEPVGELKKRALDKRVELKVAELDQKIAERSRFETWMQWLPSFDATYAWNWNSAAGFGGSNDSWMLIFGAKWDLFKGGSRIAELKTRASQMRAAGNSREHVALQILEEVENGYLEVQRQGRNIKLAEEQVSVAEQNHHLVSRQYEVGIASSLDLLNAATELANRRVLLVLDRLQYDVSILALRKAVGEYNVLASRH